MAPKLSKTAPAVTSAPIDYEDVQKEELTVLESIFGDDFEDVVAQGAWKKTTYRSFRLTVRSSGREIFVVLSVGFTATYPRSPPILKIVSGLEDLHERTAARIQNVLEKKPAQLLGDAMIHDITADIQDALEDAVIARQQNTLPSLDEERANAQETAAQFAKQAAEAEARMKLEAEEEERRERERKAKEETLRLEKRKSRKSLGQPPQMQAPAQDTIYFQAARITVDDVPTEFTEVAVTGSLINSETNESVTLGRPIVATTNGNVPVVAVKRRIVKKSNAVAWELETLMAKVARLEHHANLLNVFASRVSITDEKCFELLICREYADRGHLHDLLSISSNLKESMAQHFTRELLSGLGHLHKHNIVHGYLNVRSTYVTSGRSPSPKLSSFGLSLLGLQDTTITGEWRPPADILGSKAADIWQLGIVVVQMYLGLDTPREYESPKALWDGADLSDPMVVFLKKVFAGKKGGSSCFDLHLTELMRTNEPVLRTQTAPRSGRKSSSGHQSPFWSSSTHNPANIPEDIIETSQYAKTFKQEHRLGKGGFGEVWKVTHRTQQRSYAVKKIPIKGSDMDSALREVSLLGQVNHPNVVRFYNTWPEDDMSSAIQDDSESDEGIDSDSDNDQIEFGYSASFSATGGLDFISNEPTHQDFDDDEDDYSGDDGIAFAHSDSEHDSADMNGTSTVSGATSGKSRRKSSYRPPRILYIQMELCEGATLSSLIEKGIPEDDSWRLIRQITSGLAAIHAADITHRDLKPQNIFVDEKGIPKIGDFGLATITHLNDSDAVDSSKSKSLEEGEGATKSIGTALYMAPEMRSDGSGPQGDKVDMYSLGIIYYEMCQKFGTKMERILEVQKIRQKDHTLPAAFLPGGEKAKQGSIISRLITHKARERPRSADLLKELPLQLEEETRQQVMSELQDRNSAAYRQFMTDWFSHDHSGAQKAKGTAWDTQAVTTEEKALNVRLRNIVRGTLEAIFRRHGAEETRRDFIFPSAVREHYPTTPNVMQLLDDSGNLLQLPYDLILPYARQLARQKAATRCTFTFSGAYRNVGGPPKASVEADFDIVNNKDDNDDTALNDAEAMKVVDEALTELPQFVVATAVFHLSHGSLIDAILDACRVPLKKQLAVKNVLELVGYQSNTKGDSTWAKVDKELLNLNLVGTVVDALKKFDLTLPPTKAFEQLSKLMKDANAESHVQVKCNDAINELRRIVQCTQQFELGRKVVISPLSCHNAKFYAKGFIFTAAVQGKSGKLPLASGGRYDSLIEAQYSPDLTLRQGAVGVQIGVDPIVKLLVNSGIGKKSDFYKGPKQDQQLAKRCDVLLVTNGTEEVRKVALGLLVRLWANNVKAELSRDYKAYESQEYLLVVHLRHENSTGVDVTNTETGDASHVNLGYLVNHVQQELRDTANSRTRIPLLRHNSSYHDGDDHKTEDVEILRAERGSKKGDRDALVRALNDNWHVKLDSLKEAPIVAVELRDHILAPVAAARLSDAESWRQVIQGVRASERQLMRQLQERLLAKRESGVSYIGVYSLLSKEGILYDLTA